MLVVLGAREAMGLSLLNGLNNMAKNIALVKNGTVMNLIVADDSFIASIANQYDYTVEYTNQQIAIGYIYNPTSGAFTPPTPTAAEIKADQISSATTDMEYGMSVLTQFRIYISGLSTTQILTIMQGIITNGGSVVSLLQMGLLPEANLSLLSISNLSFLDQPYDSTQPLGQTVRQYFSSLILAGT